MAERYYGRQRAYSNLTADIEDFVKESEERMVALMQASIQDVVENAQQPRAKGGRMRIDTGFLRASGAAAINALPSGEDQKPKDALPNSFTWDGEGLISALTKMKFGDVFYFGWTAHYARYRELYDGFLEGAMQQWGRIVAFNTDTLRQRIKK